MERLAHYDREKNKQQKLEEHLFNVAVDAKNQAATIGQGDVLFLIGLYHDLGKADRRFQEKLCKRPSLHVDHSYAGAKYLLRKIRSYLSQQEVKKSERLLFTDIVTYVISAHHGVYDIRFNEEDSPQFHYNKLRKRRRGYDSDDYHFKPDVENFSASLESILPTYGYKDLGNLIEKAFADFQEVWSKLTCRDESEKDYYSACLVRLYLSLLKNADILDTINAYDLLLQPRSQKDNDTLILGYYKSVEDLYGSFGHPTTKLNKIRTQLGNRVKERGETDSTGIYRLNLPTGAGKTNLSLRYAVHQMAQQNKKRFFYMTPFLSVLEQNAAAMKKIIGREGVLEHHSNVVQKNEHLDDGQADEKSDLQSEYLIDSWDSPVVLTSMVQFFQTLFKTKSASIRRFSSLIDSIVILDEVQSLPIEVTTLFNLTMNFLSQAMNTTIVLCTATQPTYDSEAIAHPIVYGGKMAEQTDIVTITKQEQDVFTRTELRKFKEGTASSSLSQVAEFVLDHDDSILIILNTKPAVDRLYSLLESQTDRPLYQLSTNMCPQHRLDVINKIKKSLEKNIPLICVSTQLIEAGVDVDFQRVIRSYAGIDSIVQASGRCNREGKRKLGQVTLVNLTNEEENLTWLKEIKNKKETTEAILHSQSSPIDVTRLNDQFFNKYYANHQKQMDYPLGDNESVYDYLGKNEFAGPQRGKLRQAFKTAGQKMNLINDESVGVFVPYGDAKEQLADLENRLANMTYPTPEELRDLRQELKSLQLYTVNLRERDPRLEATRSYLDGQILFLQEEYYDKVRGIIKEADNLIL